jgi:hypothetical protein
LEAPGRSGTSAVSGFDNQRNKAKYKTSADTGLPM